MTEPTTLILVRHGEIRANVRGRWHGATDSPLTGTGRRQADRVARHLAHRFGHLDALYSSPLRRCAHTAKMIAARLERSVVVDDDLREWGIGTLEDTTYRDLAARHDFFRRIGEDPDYAPPGGDSLRRVERRIVGALRRIHATHAGGRHVAIVGHGAALAIALAALLDADPARWTHYPLANCSVTELYLEPEPLVAALNRIEHL
jgi:broad specificity phosphatase PhoE